MADPSAWHEAYKRALAAVPLVVPPPAPTPRRGPRGELDFGFVVPLTGNSWNRGSSQRGAWRAATLDVAREKARARMHAHLTNLSAAAASAAKLTALTAGARVRERPTARRQ